MAPYGRNFRGAGRGMDVYLCQISTELSDCCGGAEMEHDGIHKHWLQVMSLMFWIKPHHRHHFRWPWM